MSENHTSVCRNEACEIIRCPVCFKSIHKCISRFLTSPKQNINPSATSHERLHIFPAHHPAWVAWLAACAAFQADEQFSEFQLFDFEFFMLYFWSCPGDYASSIAIEFVWFDGVKSSILQFVVVLFCSQPVSPSCIADLPRGLWPVSQS